MGFWGRTRAHQKFIVVHIEGGVLDITQSAGKEPFKLVTLIVLPRTSGLEIGADI